MVTIPQEVEEIDQDKRLREYLSTNEGREIYALIRGAVFRHLQEILSLRKPVEESKFDLAKELHLIGMIGSASEEFVHQKEREWEQRLDNRVRVI